jgi:uncharacterized protein (DUF2164 family)
MPVYFPEEHRKQAIGSIKRYFDEVLDQDIGELKAEMMLDYVLKELAPTVYNQAIQDAQKFVNERVGDMESSVFAAEFAYWEKGARRK